MNHLHQRRRKFLQWGATGIVTAFFGSLPKISFGSTLTAQDPGVVVRKDEGIHILTGRKKVPMNIKISKEKNGVQGISFCMEDMDPGRRMRVHKHLNNDELIFINKGSGRFTLGEQLIKVEAGDVMFIPRGTWHGLDNTGEENLVMVFQYSPAGFEQYFIENGTIVGQPVNSKTEEEYAITEKKYGMVYRDKL